MSNVIITGQRHSKRCHQGHRPENDWAVCGPYLQDPIFDGLDQRPNVPLPYGSRLRAIS